MFFAIFLSNPINHFTASVIIKIDVNIGQRNTVGIEKTLKQQIIFQRVNIGNFKAISNYRTGCRATSRSYGNAQFFARHSYIILNNKEITRVTHRFHNVQLKRDAFFQFVTQIVAVTHFCAFPCQQVQIVRFEFYTIEFVITAQFPYLLFGSSLTQNHFAFFVPCKFIE